MIPSFGNLLFTVGAFIVALLVIVTVHEFGHYIIARLTGIYAEVFSLGFGPVLFSRTDKRGTRWQLAALPFGGYVKFLGDADAASGKDAEAMDAMSKTDLRHTMHGAPLWARAATVAAGPVFNFILSIAIFTGIVLWRGLASDPLTVGELHQVPYVQELQPGDVIEAIEGRKIPSLSDLGTFVETLDEKTPLTYTVLRDGRQMDLRAPYPYPPYAIHVTPGSAADEAGVRAGDTVLAANGTPVATFDQLRRIVGQSGGKPLTLEIWRDGKTLDLTLNPKRADLPKRDGSFETRWLIGISGSLLFEPKTERPGLLTALGYGAKQTYFIVQSSVSGLYHVIAGAISTCNLRGPVGIAQTAGQQASEGWLSFIWFISVLSTAVGFLNLFPIPVLDGGHLVFHVYEAITGRPPSDGALRWLMAIGLTLILAMMLFALTNDLTCP